MHKSFVGVVSVFLFALAALVITPSSAQAQTACDADIVANGIVDLADYSQLSTDFFTPNLRSDINKDGSVNLLDYSILSTFFFQNCVAASPTANPTASASASPATSPSSSPSSSPVSSPVITPSPSASPTSSGGLLISQAEIMARPTSGTAWDNLVTYANKSNALPNFEASDDAFQSDETNVIYLAKAIVGVRTNNQAMINQVQAGLQAIVDSNPTNYNFRALGLGRELAAYVIAADIIDLKTTNPTLHNAFKTKINFLRTVPVPGGPDTLIECSTDRPNNWGTHCTASRIAVALYLEDQAEVAASAQVFKGWLGDRSAYASFSYGTLSWQCNSTQPVGINPQGCVLNGHPADGAQPEERRRAQDTYSWPPAPSDYEWEGLQGPFLTALLLEKHGYPDVWQWSDKALLRAVMWNYSGVDNYSSMNFPSDPNSTMKFPAVGDDNWIPHIVNKRYNTTIPTSPARPGKNVGYTDWLL